MNIKHLSTVVFLLTCPTIAFSAYEVVIKTNVPINFINNPDETPTVPEEPEPDTGLSVHNITVGLHPNYAVCVSKLKGFAINSICGGIAGNYGGIDKNSIKINDVNETVGQVYGYPSGGSCVYAFQLLNNGQYDSLPPSLSMNWNGASYTGTKSNSAFPTFISYRFTSTCDMWNSWSAGTNLNIQIQQ
jgi:hypothetical protein